MSVYEISEKVERMLRDEKINAECWPFAGDDGVPCVIVSIHWGDWKHDHGRAKWLCKQHGGTYIGSVVTEEDGSDCYSAEHSVLFVEGFKEDEED